MIFSSLVVGDRSWFLPAGALAMVAVALLVTAYRRIRSGNGSLVPPAALKAIALLMLAAFLVEPLWSSTRARPGANQFVVLVDNSASLAIKDTDEDRSRGELLAAALLSAAEDEKSWSVRLEQDFDVRRYTMAERLARVRDFGSLDFAGASTGLNTALKSISERYRNRNIAGILLITDGNVTDLDSGEIDVKDLPPIYPVVIGDGSGLDDLRIQSLAVRETSFEDAPITISAGARTIQPGGDEVTAQLLDEERNVVDELTIAAGGDDLDTYSFRFQVRPDQAGVAFYQIEATPADGDIENEATLANNAQLVCINRDHRRRRVLYVSGRPNWEYKFLNRALQGDDQLELVGLIRVAKREAKFDFRGRDGESSNALYRGFKKEGDEETESYDQPVLVRTNIREGHEDELRDGFPKSALELFAYDAIVIDDLEAAFFTADQQDLIDRFVSKRGGALLMLGGQESFRNGGYDRTPVGRMLPVYLDRLIKLPEKRNYRLHLTREGWLQPWMRLRKTEDDERNRLDNVPSFRTVNQLATIKPGATVLASVDVTPTEQVPALVVQNYGKGKSAAITIGDLWRWRLKEDRPADRTVSLDESDQAKGWRQFMRWMVVDVPKRVDVDIQPATDVASAATRLTVRVRNEEYEAVENAGVKVTVTTPKNESVEIDADAADEAGTYEAVYVARESGAFRATVSATAADGSELGAVKTGWVSDPARQEFASVEPNRRLLETLAKQTGGEIVELAELSDFADGLSSKDVPVTEQWTWPLWHQSWVFLLALVCLVGEWGLRRMRGLP